MLMHFIFILSFIIICIKVTLKFLLARFCCFYYREDTENRVSASKYDMLLVLWLPFIRFKDKTKNILFRQTKTKTVVKKENIWSNLIKEETHQYTLYNCSLYKKFHWWHSFPCISSVHSTLIYILYINF